MTSTQHVRVEGTSYQRGRQYGRQAAARVRLSVQAYQQVFAYHPTDLALWAMPSSLVRLQRLRAARARTHDDFRAPLTDHADHPDSVCAHPDPADHPGEQGITVASVLMNLTEKHIWLAAGNPCQVPYERLDIAL